jgi:hypothetical protein
VSLWVSLVVGVPSNVDLQEKPSRTPIPSPLMESAAVAIVTMSFPAQGHLNQLLHQSLLLVAQGLHGHFAAPPRLGP